MPRLFVALPVPDTVADALEALQNGVPDARWLAPESLHVTLCFCGEVDGGTMQELIEALADVPGMALSVEIAGVELFAEGKKPKALVATVVRTELLAQLQSRVTSAARSVGIEIDRRRFRPHVTLARFANRAETGHHLAQFIAGHSLFRTGPWDADTFVLYSSRTSKDGAVYTPEVEYDLTS